MSDPLDEYRGKRDFRITPEPAPAEVRSGGDSTFVVHRHEARNLHYDLRLQHNGVLCSWAVPKGFSYDPTEKRLAVRTEDHPLEYEHFHGRIPRGQYGAGTMMIWDRGRYELVKITDWDEALARGELKLRLCGRRLRGEWHLVRTQQANNSWLLFKSRDSYSGHSRDSALGVDIDTTDEVAIEPDTLRPMRCAGERATFTDPAWVFEMEFAGHRCFAQKNGATSAILGLDDAPATVRAALLELRCERALIDGVLVALDPHGLPSLSLLRSTLAGDDRAHLAYYAFDLLQWEDYDLRRLPLFDRKAALRTLIPDHRHLFYVDHVAGNG
ncbi:MAG: ATP-dependent DNA ligase, partial [Planctomycetes bacterium]|nr:ATP-dependent DNA ligase [Planctomycetota bacterium]